MGGSVSRTFLFVLGLLLGLAPLGAGVKADLKSLFADKPPLGTTPVEATWIQGNIFLPSGALKSQGGDHMNIFAKKDDWAETARDKHLKEGVRLPAVLYMH